MNQFMSGGIFVGMLLAALFFFRFWKRTGDRLFLLFGFSFGIHSAERLLLFWVSETNEMRPYIYLIRLLAFLVIIAAIVDKNRHPRTN
jgi:hypothetical protein